MPSLGDRLVGRYQLIHPIGAGGMAIVWRARDLRLERPVAVKILRPELAQDPDLARRFASEARHAASLSHPNVAAVYDTDVDGEQQFIVMELVDGPSVAELLRDRGTLDPNVAVEIAASAARALAAAHRRGLIHRDVKPANLLIGHDGRTRLADFGIARALTVSRVTTPGTILGSVPYLSPEQARGEEATASGDVFSLGVVLFEMLTGRLPWEADTPAGLATVRLNVPAPPPSQVARALPQGLDAIVGRALAVDPADRYPSARGFAEALEAWNRRSRGTRRARTALRSAIIKPEALASPLTAEVAGATGAASMTAFRPGPSQRERGASIVGTASANPGASLRRAPAPTKQTRRSPATSGALVAPHRDRTRGLEMVLLALALVLPLAVVAALLIGGPTPGTDHAVGPVAVESPSPTTAAAADPTTLVFPSPRASVLVIQPAAPPVTEPPTPVRPPATARPPAPNGSTGPAHAVRDFYHQVEQHDWDAAIARWSPSMQRRYPPDEWLIDRFRPTTRIDITDLRTTFVNRDSGRATVAVTLVEYRRVGPSPRRFSGSWELVWFDGRWLLDQPHF